MAIERQPLYEQVEHAIEEGIRTEEWPAGSVLPSETALAERFGVSVCTVRKALDALAQKNHVEKRHGIGTFVTSYSSRGYWNRFQRYQMLDGTLPRWSDRIVTCERRRPSERVLKALGLTELSKALPEDGLLWRLERRMALNGRPMGTDVVWFHPEHFGKLCSDAFEHRPEGSLYAFFERAFGVVVTDVKDTIEVRIVTAEDARRYDLPVDQPLLELYRIGYTFGRRPVEYRIEHVLPEGLRIVLE